jgi:hypothetical protein
MAQQATHSGQPSMHSGQQSATLQHGWSAATVTGDLVNPPASANAAADRTTARQRPLSNLKRMIFLQNVDV